MNAKILLSFAAIYIIWGSTFTAIKWGLDSFPPFMLAGMRFMLAGMVFFLLAKKSEIKNMTRADIFNEFRIGILLTLGNAGVCWAEQYISSGVAALIVGALPVMFMIFNWVSFEKKTPNISALLAFVVGMSGITLISLDKSSASDWKVVAALLIANCAWVTGSLLFRNSKSTLSYYPRASMQTFLGGLTWFIFSFVIGERAVSFESIRMEGIMSVLYLAFAGTLLAYTAYSFLLKNVRTEITSTYALINPLLALLFGVLFLNEPFSLKTAVSTVLILMSVLLVLYGDKLFKPQPVKVLSNEPAIDLKECG
jgi:drug/metabolite transporter (DMT)-like permease